MVVPQSAVEPPLILHLEPKLAEFAGLMTEAPWGEAWNEVRIGPSADLAAHFDLVLTVESADFHLTVPPTSGIRTALWCRHPDTLEGLQRLRSVTALVLSPSRLAILDLWRRQRRTLVASKDIDRGAIIEPADVGTVIGGFGVDQYAAEAIIGRRAANAIRSGDAIDFGSIL